LRHFSRRHCVVSHGEILHKTQVKNPRLKDRALRKHPIGVCGALLGRTYKSEARNTKWFDWLTILSEVEGQYRMTKIQMTQTALCGTRFRDCAVEGLFLSFEDSRFEFVPRHKWGIRPATSSAESISDLTIWGSHSRRSHRNMTIPPGRGFSQ